MADLPVTIFDVDLDLALRAGAMEARDPPVRFVAG